MAEAAPVRQVRVLLNEGGRIIERGPQAVRHEVEAAFGRHGVRADVRLVRGTALRAEAALARDAAVAGEIDAVVVGGGDGTVGTVAGVLAGTGVPMGVLPLGTLNHFAKDLGMPPATADAVATIATARPRPVDVGEVNGIVFVNNAVIGVYPFMVSDRERRRRLQGLGKWPAMALAFLRMMVQFPRRRLKLKLGDREHRYRTPCLFVGVNEYRLEQLELRRHGGMDRGLLWILAAHHQRPLAFVAFALRSAWRGLDPDGGDFDLHRVPDAVVRAKASRVPLAHDGEVTMLTSPVRFKVRPRALEVLAPGRSAGVVDNPAR